MLYLVGQFFQRYAMAAPDAAITLYGWNRYA